MGASNPNSGPKPLFLDRRVQKNRFWDDLEGRERVLDKKLTHFGPFCNFLALFLDPFWGFFGLICRAHSACVKQSEAFRGAFTLVVTSRQRRTRSDVTTAMRGKGGWVDGRGALPIIVILFFAPRPLRLITTVRATIGPATALTLAKLPKPTSKTGQKRCQESKSKGLQPGPRPHTPYLRESKKTGFETIWKV